MIEQIKKLIIDHLNTISEAEMTKENIYSEFYQMLENGVGTKTKCRPTRCIIRPTLEINRNARIHKIGVKNKK